MDVVAYYRVSTKRQGRSGLGLEAQQAAVAEYVKQHGARVLASYREVETGKSVTRPELAKALAHAKRSKAVLLVGKLDRLARNVAFTATLMDSGADFRCCDNPVANRLTLHILAAVAEDEAARISARTSAALQAAKARGVKLGAARRASQNLTQAHRERGAKAAGEAATRLANEAYADLLPSMKAWRGEGVTLDGIAARLNSKGQSTRTGRPWTASTVYNVLGRA